MQLPPGAAAMHPHDEIALVRDAIAAAIVAAMHPHDEILVRAARSDLLALVCAASHESNRRKARMDGPWSSEYSSGA